MSFKYISFATIGMILFGMVFLGCEKEPPEPLLPLFDQVKGFAINGDNTKFVATNTGLFSYTDGTWKMITLADSNATLLNDLVYSGDHQLWLATNAGILNQSAGSSITNSNSCLENDLVSRIFVDQDDRIFLSTGTSVIVIDGEQCIETLGSDDLFAGFEITDIGTTTNNYTFVTTLGGGVGRFTQDVDGITGATIFNEDWTPLGTNNIYTVFIDDTTQWYGSDIGTAMHFSHSTKWDWQTYSRASGLVSDSVISIAKDSDGSMWFGTYKGVSRFDGDAWISYTRNSHGLISDTINFIAAGNDGTVWIATGSGLAEFNGTQWINHPNIEDIQE